MTSRNRFDSLLNSAFEILERLLYGYNFEVFLQHYFAPASQSTNNLHDALSSMLKKEKIDLVKVKPIEVNEILAQLEEFLLHEGAEHSGPLTKNLNSQEFKEKYNFVRTEPRELCKNAGKIESFILDDESHPAYPVYLGFTYAIYTGNGMHVVIGSSSD